MIGLCALWPLTIGAHQPQKPALASPVCEIVQPQQRGGEKILEVGKIWAGVRTMIGAAEPTQSKMLVAYYDADRWVTIASADAVSGKVCRLRLKSRFLGWDGHNSLVMAMAPDGSLHIAGNAHASPLFYAQAKSGDLATIRTVRITGRDENHATYPTFLKDAAGHLLLFYRSGGSGDGAWIADRWSGGGWNRLGSSFAAVDRAGAHISAYPSPFVADQHGTSHVAIVWRRTPDVATNFAVGYAKTADFKRWSGAKSAGLKGPVRPDQIDMVEQPGEKSGLLNNARLLLSADGRPVLFYTRYGASGMDALIAAHRTEAGWAVKEIASSDHRTPIEGEGSLAGAPVFSVSSSGNVGTIAVTFPNGPHRSFQLDLTTLEVLKTTPGPSAAPPKSAQAFLTIPVGLAKASPWSQPVTASGFDGHSLSRVIWYAQGLNNDHAWTCTARFPQACTPPPSPLLWIIPADRQP